MATEEELRDATDIAYLDLSVGFENLINDGKNPPFTIKAILDAMPPMEKTENLPSYVLDWEIVDYRNDNEPHQSGFYGSVIDTGNGLIVSFRGSESITDINHVKSDWVGADLALLSTTLTKQQEQAGAFLKQIATSDYIDKYDNVAFTGHSLGGNLAEHATIVSHKYGLDEKIKQTVSFDGPGFSEEYIRHYKEQIDAMSGKMTHFQYSVVGNILQKLPGVKFESLAVTGSNMGTKHSTSYLEFDNKGNANRGDQDIVSAFIGHFTQGLDHLPKKVGDILVDVTGALLIAGVWTGNRMFDENKNLTDFGWTIVRGAVGIVAVVGVVPTLVFVSKVVLVTLTAIAAVAAFEFFYDGITWLVDKTCELVGKALNWTKRKIDELKQFVISEIKRAKQWFNETFNTGYKYATSNPIIKVDTHKLRSYADRLESVNRRLNSIDSRMNSLYWSVGFLDLFALLQADLFTDESLKLKRCISYLDHTASDFEKAERNIISRL